MLRLLNWNAELWSVKNKAKKKTFAVQENEVKGPRKALENCMIPEIQHC